MGDGLTEEEESPQISQTPYGDTFDRLFPHYLVMGMTPEQYWDGESSWKKAYREAYRLRTENEWRLNDRSNWYMGQYIISVLQAVPLFVGGLNTSGVTLPEYPDKPFFEKEEERKSEEQRKKEEENQMMYAMAMMQAQFEAFNKAFKAEHPEQADNK